MFTDAEIRRIEREDAARLKELGGGLADAIQIDFLDHVLEPMVVEAGALGPNPSVPDLLVNIVCIPTGFHLAEGVHRHATRETRVVEIDGEERLVTVGRWVPNLVPTERAAATIEQKPSKVDVMGPVFERAMPVEPETPIPSVTAEEIAAARAEAKALRELARGQGPLWGSKGQKLREPTVEERIWGSRIRRRQVVEVVEQPKVIRSQEMPVMPATVLREGRPVWKE